MVAIPYPDSLLSQTQPERPPLSSLSKPLIVVHMMSTCRQKELAAVKLQKEDIELVAFECEIDKKAAEARLREHRGDVKATLIAFL